MSAALKLDVFHDGQHISEVPLVGEVWAGRDSECAVCLDDRAVSRKHGVFKVVGNVVQLEKKSSFGEMKVNGRDVELTTLKIGDRVSMGPFEIEVKSGQAPVQQPAPEQPFIEPVQVTQALETPTPIESLTPEPPILEFQEPAGQEIEPHEPTPHESTSIHLQTDFNEDASEGVDSTRIFNANQSKVAFLIFETTQGATQKYEMVDHEVVLGRASTCHVVLDDPRSSRQNTVIRNKENRYWIQDLGSVNGTQLNGQDVIEETELQSGDRVRVGDTEFSFQLMLPDFEQQAAGFMSVPAAEQVMVASPEFQPVPSSFQNPNVEIPGVHIPGVGVPGAVEASDSKRSIIGRLIDSYRTMNTRKQIIYGALIAAGIWVFMQDDPDPNAPRAKLNVGQQVATPQKKKKPEAVQGVVTFESLSPEQQRYIEAQYQLGLDFFKARDYDKSLFEIEKIFKIIPDYKQAKEVYSMATEAKRRLEAREEEKRRKEEEQQRRLHLQELIDQAAAFMEKKAYTKAEVLFPEIELLEPENTFVNSWRNQIAAEKERLQRLEDEKQKRDALNQSVWKKYREALVIKNEQRYYDAIEALEAVYDLSPEDPRLVQEIKNSIRACYRAIETARQPLLQAATELEKSGQLIEAYHKYEELAKLDPESDLPQKAMQKIRDTLTEQVKSVYIEGVFAESYDDYETARRKFSEVLSKVPSDHEYYVKAHSRLNRLAGFKLKTDETPDDFGSEEGRAPSSVKAPKK